MLRTAALALTVALTAASNADPQPAPVPAAEPPAALDPVEVTAEAKLERRLRQVQLGLRRSRSNSVADLGKLVCFRMKPTGSNISRIHCATNSRWEDIHTETMKAGGSMLRLGPYASGVGTWDRDEDDMFTMSLNQFRRLERRYGPLPAELEAQL